MATLNDRFKEFSQTPSGKIAVVAVPVALLAVILAFVALTLLKSGPGPEPSEVTQVETSTSPTSQETSVAPPVAGGATTVTEEADAEANVNYEVYETRDPFKPVEATSTAATANVSVSAVSTGGGSTTSTVSTGASTQQTEALALDSVDNQNGTLYANVKYGSTPYTVRPGDRVGASPFQLIAVAADNATFLYGDDQLTLAVGESVDK